MKTFAFWLLLAGCGYFAVRGTVADNRLWWERRPGAPLWKLWVSPWRHLSRDLYTEAGERERRVSLRSLGWALLLGFLALVVSQM